MQSSDLMEQLPERFSQDLEDLRSSVLAMGGLVESQLAAAIEAVVSGNSELGLKVAHDDYKVNRAEVAIDEECSRILAASNSTPSDLRLIVAVIKTITDLERIGDEAEKIGFLASKLATMDRPRGSYRELKSMGSHVKRMVQSAMDAFARLDAAAALQMVRDDEEVDQEYENIQRQCITFMMEDPRTIKRVMNVTWAARSLERIGDHAKNIGEYVIYMVHGKDVRHIATDEIELGAVPELEETHDDH
ncbi:MAG: phosphate signaling complex protein PhoU [Woeseiaceae bacterium]